MLLIKNGRVLDPTTKTDATLDVLLDGERIARVGRESCGARTRKYSMRRG